MKVKNLSPYRIVWVTKSGTRAHMDGSCPHLNATARKVEATELPAHMAVCGACENGGGWL